MDKAEQLRKLGEAIYDKGNSHNPEYWEAGEIIRSAASRLNTESDQDAVDEAVRSHRRALKHQGSRVKEDAHNTIIAVLSGAADGIRCNGCGEPKQMDQDGYCWSCRELYDRKPE